MHKKYILLGSLASLLILSGCGTPIQKPDDSGDLKAENIFGSGSGNTIEYGDNNDNYQLPPANQNQTQTQTANTNSSNNTKPMEFDASKHYTVTLHTSEGDIEIAMNYGQTPNTVKNFVELSKKDFYNGTIFHRVMKGFMIQGGDPNGNGTGGPGYKFDDEKFTGEYTRGTVAMANSGPNTNGSQFFIMHADVPLQKLYTIFGHVVEGMDVVDKIADSKVTANPFNPSEMSVPVTPTKIDSVTVTEK